MADLAKLVVRLEAESSKLHSELQRANAQISRFGKNTQNAMGLAKKAIAGLSVGIVLGKLASMAKEAIDAGDQLGKMSQKVGLSVEKLSALQYSASLADVSTQQLETGLVKLSRTLGQSGTQGERQREILAALGITSSDTGEVVLQVADRFSKMEDSAVKTAAAVELFGRAGAQLIPLLNAGADGLRAQEDELRRLGALMGTDVAKDSEELNDNLTRLNTAFTGVKLKILGDALPALVRMTEGFVRWLSTGDRVLDIANRIGIAFEAMGIAIKVAAGFIAGGLIGGPIGAAIGATIAGLDEILDRMDKLRMTGPVVTGKIERTPAATKFLEGKEAAASTDIYTAALKNLGLTTEASAEAEREREAALKAALAAQQQARQRITDYVGALTEERDLLGASRDQTVAYQLAKMGANEATIKFAQSLAVEIERTEAAIDAEKRWQEVRAELSGQVDEIAAALRTEEEAIRETYARREQIVEQALEERLVSEARAIEIIKQLHTKEAEEIQKLADKNKDALTKFAEEAAANIQDAMADTFFNWMQGEFDNIGTQFKQMLDRMVANALAAKLAEAMFGAGFGSTTSQMGGWVGKLLPIVTGAFGGGAAAGTNAAASSAGAGLDSMIAAAISPRANGGPVFPGGAYLVGERGPELFSPATAGRINPDVGGGGVVVNMNISGITDSRGIRESSAQLAARAGTAVQRAQQRNT